MLFRLAHTPILNRLLLYVTPRFLVRRNLEEVYGDPSRLTDAVPPDDAAQTTIDAPADADSDTSAPSMLSVEDPTKTANTMLAILATLPVGTKLGRYVLRKSRWSRIVFAQGMWAMWWHTGGGQ